VYLLAKSSLAFWRCSSTVELLDEDELFDPPVKLPKTDRSTRIIGITNRFFLNQGLLYGISALMFRE
jgi:hypothetical protein